MISTKGIRLDPRGKIKIVVTDKKELPSGFSPFLKTLDHIDSIARL
jgi:hypothetical protein